ncbi:hypothetical protein G6048_22345 [Streptomyces sp. YC419]|uniref:Inhibitor I9 domain-containing protein n=1 Tax=Streptomyces ureilyticus TaxID=1775131 RepID=A0ABX0DSB7_9ACTN|nr:hypothetical protein [Streptomyces ureilyticus]
MAVMRHARRRLAGIATGISATALVAGLVTALPAQAAAAPVGPVQYAGAPGTIANSYIVTLDADAAKAGSAEGRALAKEYGATIERTYKKALNGYAVEATEAEAKRFAADPARPCGYATRCGAPRSSCTTAPSASATYAAN